MHRPAPGDRLPLLSRRALLRAAALAGCGHGPDVLAPLLYRAGAVALGPRARRTHDPRWLAWLAVSSARATPGLLEGWAPQTGPHWQSFSRPDLDRDRLRHKVYVSPLPHALSAALPVVLRVVVELQVPSIKVGGTAQGVLRPDKLVLHTTSAATADALAVRLAERLAGLPAQGVPFTGQCDPVGLVSRGTDPPGTSWRAFVTAVAAAELAAAAAQLPGARAAEVLELAVTGIAAAGLDSTTWQPPRDRVLL